LLTDYYTPFTIEDRTGAGDFDGISWTSIGVYFGFIQPVSMNAVFKDGKGGESATHRLYTGMTTPVKYGYKVTQNGQSYIQPAGISGVGDHKEIMMGLFE
jgi:hypothetical protein